jgi:hypothetical protein
VQVLRNGKKKKRAKVDEEEFDPYKEGEEEEKPKGKRGRKPKGEKKKQDNTPIDS